MTSGASLEQAKVALRDGLRTRRPELEKGILARVYGIADPSEVEDPQYLEGLRNAVAAGIEFGLEAIESESERVPQIPPVLLVQARLAARNRISLDTVMRRYSGGNTLFGEMLIEEAGRTELPPVELKRIFRVLAASFEQLLAAIGDEYGREAEALAGKGGSRRLALIERLLAGEAIGSKELAYELDERHLGLVGWGPRAGEALRRVGRATDRRVLLVDAGEDLVWGWFGGSREFGKKDLEQLSRVRWPDGVAVGCGEPGSGICGWRQTHRQAGAAMPVARKVAGRFVRYSDVALVAAVLQDELLASSLRELYLEPLSAGRDRGVRAKETLRAYFEASGNSSSAAAALGVSRRTIATRLAAIEERLGRPVDDVSAELEIVLQLDELLSN